MPAPYLTIELAIKYFNDTWKQVSPFMREEMAERLGILAIADRARRMN